MHTEEGSSQFAVLFKSESGPLGNDDCVDGVNEMPFKNTFESSKHMGQRQIRKQFQCDCMLMTVLHAPTEL